MFNEQVDAATVNPQAFAVHSMWHGQVLESAGSVITDGATITIDPAAEFFPGEIVQASVTSAIESVGGEPAEGVVWQFRTAVPTGTGIFSDSGQSLGDHASRSVELGDLDSDGDLDAFIANSNGQGNRVWVNHGYARLSDSGQSLGSANSFSIALGDLDSDGDLDAFVANDGANTVWWNDGGIFSDSGQMLGGEASYGVAVGDLDGDGDLDAFVGNKGVGNRVWLNDDGQFSVTEQRLGSWATVGVALGDLDGDGDLDAYSANDDSQGNQVWIGDGRGAFSNSGQNLGAHSSSSVALGDLDGDGDLDAFVTNRNEGNQRWVNLGDRFDTPIDLFGNANEGAAFGDLDGDGDLDVFIANGGGQGSPVFTNNGFGSLTDSGQSIGNHSSTDVALGDLDGDGDLDALVTNPFERDRIWLNGTSPSPLLPPRVTLAVDSPLISEAQGSATFTAHLSRPAAQVVAIDLAFSGTASWQEDYTASDDQIRIPPGSSSGTILIEAVQDPFWELTETVIVDIVNVFNAQEVVEQTKTTAIVDDDDPPPVTLSLDSAEIDENGGTATLFVNLLAPSVLDVIVALSFKGGATLFDDYLPPNPQVLIPAGEVSRAVTLTSIDDDLNEPNESVLIDFGLVINGSDDGLQQQALRIIDDDPLPGVTLSVDSTAILEDGGTATATATLSEVSGRDVSVELEFSGTAEYPDRPDYVASHTGIVIEKGATTGSVTLTAIQDDFVEPDETIVVAITDVTHGRVLGTPEKTITIIDDDRPPTVTLTADQSVVSEAGGIATFTVALATAFSKDVVIEFGITGSATQNQDFFAAGTRLTVRAGNTTGVLAIFAIQDTLQELGETIVVDILGVINGFELGEQQQTVIILDDDTPPIVNLSVTELTIPEESGVATIEAMLSTPFRDEVTIQLDFAGTATIGEDFGASASQIVIPAGVSSGSVIVSSVQDFLIESDESILIDIASVTNGEKGADLPLELTIVDDDEPPLVTLDIDSSEIAEEAGSATVTVNLSRTFGQEVTIDLGFAGSAHADIDFLASSSTIVVPAGAVAATMVISSLSDLIDEHQESIVIDILQVTNGMEVGEQQQVVLIEDDDDSPFVTLSADHQTIPEAAGIATITVQLSAVSGKDVVVDLTVGGTAEKRTDFVSTDERVAIAAGTTTGTFTIIAFQDPIDEVDETVIVGLGDIVNADPGSESQSVTIVDDDAPPFVTLAVDNLTIPETEGTATFVASTSVVSGRDVTVELTFSGTAEVGTDYIAAGNTIVIPAGVTSGSVTLTSVPDLLDEADETITVEISAATNAELNGTQRQTTTIVDDDKSLPIVRLSVTEMTIPEESGIAVIEAMLSAPFRDQVTIQLDFAGTATIGEDFEVSASEIVVPAGATAATRVISSLSDLLDENEESIVIEILEVTNGMEVGEQQQVVTIVDDDAPPFVTLAVDNLTIPEREGTATFVATTSVVSGRDVSVELTFSGTAEVGTDYIASGNTIVIPAGVTSGSVTLTSVPDLLDEADETITVEITGVENGQEAENQQQTAVIVDDDIIPLVSLSIDQIEVSETAGTATFTVSLSEPALLPVTIDLSITGTADPILDYTVSDTHLVIPPGVLSGSITVVPIPDEVVEADETVIVEISAVTNAELNGTQRQTTTIVDDDESLPFLTLQIDNDEIAERDGMATIVAQISAPTDVRVSVELGLTGTAVASSDYTISSTEIVIEPGATSGTAEIMSIHDFAAEGDETIVIDALSTTNATHDGQTVTTVIKDDDLPTVSLFWNNTFIAENKGTILLTAILSRLAGDPGVPVTIELEFVGTATLGTDFTAVTQIVIPAGNLNATIVVDAIPDVLFEGNETITVEILTVTNAAEFETQTETIVLIDDDVPPSVMLGIDEARIIEGGSSATIAATLSTISGLPVVIDLGFTGTATFGIDYVAPAQLTIPAGATSATAAIAAQDDGFDEGDEQVLVTIANATNASVLSNQPVLTTIADADLELVVTAFVPTTSGFVVEFNKRIDLAELNLFDTQSGEFGPADVLLVGESVGNVTGSLVVDASHGKVTFIKSGGPLAPDTYTVTLRSGPTGFATTGGAPLYGSGSETTSGDFVGEFTVASSAAAAVAAPDFVRGGGQDVHLPADNGNGIPLTISEGADARSIEFRIQYNPDLLELSAASLGVDAPEDATIQFDHLGPGLVRVEFSSARPLNAGTVNFARLIASIPPDANAKYYGTQQVLDFHGVVIRNETGDPVASVADDALHVVVYFGDSSANARINASDAARVARFAALIDGGFAALPNTDPLFIGDISGNGRVNAADASLVARAAGLLTVPEIPALPDAAGLAVLTASSAYSGFAMPPDLQPHRPEPPYENASQRQHREPHRWHPPFDRIAVPASVAPASSVELSMAELSEGLTEWLESDESAPWWRK